MEKGNPTHPGSSAVISAVVQLLTKDNQCAGTGFAVYPQGLVVTCAHVVNAALGLDAKRHEAPATPVRLSFIATQQSGEGEVMAWSPYTEHDVAVLRVEDSLLKGVQPLTLFDLSDLRGRAFRVYGFPKRAGYEKGRYARGQLGDLIADGKLQAHSDGIRAGDSGSFVQELQMGRIVGMVSAVDIAEANVFLIPARTIERICPEIVLQKAYYPFSPLTDGLVGLPGNALINLEDFLYEYLGLPEQPAPFGGREQALASLDSWLANPAVAYGLIAQPAGQGKSALLTQWAARVVAERRADVIFVPISQRFDTALYSRLCAMLGTRLRYLCAPDTERPLPTSAEQWWPEIDSYLRNNWSGEQPLLIVLDGLDEAADWKAERDLKFPRRLGMGIKVLVSVRLIEEDEDATGWLTRLRWQNFAYVIPLEPLTEREIADVLTAMGNPLDKLATQIDIIKELYKLTEGDPLLVRLYVDALLKQDDKLAFLTPEDLPKLPPGLAGYFNAWFEAQDRIWEEQQKKTLYERETVIIFLNLLAHALGPLSREDIAELSGAPFNQWHQLEIVIKTVARFVLGDGANRGYIFSHPRLTQYFQGRMLESERNEWQRRYLDYGLRTLQDLTAKRLSPAKVSRYLVQYYGAHLVLAHHVPYEAFYRLVNQHWMQAWMNLEGTYAGFLNDVDRAWDRAMLSENWGQQVRCALCHSSVVALSSNVPVTLLKYSFKTKILSVPQVLQIGLHHPDSVSKIEILLFIAPKLSNAERRRILHLALETAMALPVASKQGDYSPRGEALVALAPHLSKVQREGALRVALEAALTLPIVGGQGSHSPQVEALAALAPYLPAALLTTALKATLALPVERVRRGPSLRIEALAALAPYLPAALLTTALETALTLPIAAGQEDHSPRVEALVALAPHLPEAQHERVLPVALEAALALPVAGGRDHSPRGEALAALAPYLPAALLTTALEAALALPAERVRRDHSPRGEALAALAPYLPVALLTTALEAALALPVVGKRENRSPRVEALVALAPHLPEAQREGALQRALEAALALPVVGKRENHSPRVEALVALVPHLPEAQREGALQRALEAALALPVVGERGGYSPRVEALVALAPHLPEAQHERVLPVALEAALALPVVGRRDHSPRGEALAALAPYLPVALLTTALEAALALPVVGGRENRSPRVEALVALAPHLPEAQRERALQRALEAALALPIEGERGGYSPRGEALAALAPYLPAALLTTALEAALALPVVGEQGDHSPLGEALVALAPYLPEAQREGALQRALSYTNRINDKIISNRIQVRLIFYFFEAQREGALQRALEVALALPVVGERGAYSPRVEALVALAPHLPEAQREGALQRALEVALALPIEGERGGYSPRGKALAALAPSLPAALLTTTLEAALALPIEGGLGGYSPRSEALVALAPYLPAALLTTALEAALTLPAERVRRDRSPQVEALAALAPYLPVALLTTALETALALPVVGEQGDHSPLGEALVALVPHLPEAQREGALQRALEAALALPVVGERGGYSPRVEALVALAPHLPEAQRERVLPVALEAALALPITRGPVWQSYGGEALVALVSRLSEPLREGALQEAQAGLAWVVGGKRENHSPRGEALAALAPYLPVALLTTALEAALALPVVGEQGDHSPLGEALVALVPHLPEAQREGALQRALEVALALPVVGERGGYSPRVEALVALAPHLPEAQRERVLPVALEAALALPITRGPVWQSYGGEALAPHFSKSQHSFAFGTIQKVALALPIEGGLGGYSPRSEALVALAPYLPAALLTTALEAALTLPVERDLRSYSPRTEILVALAPHLLDKVPIYFRKALAQTIRDYSKLSRPKMLYNLEILLQKTSILQEPEVVKELLWAIKEVTNWWP